MALVIKNPPANVGDLRDEGSVPGSGRLPGGRHDISIQYSCLESSMYRGAWWGTVHRVTKELDTMKVTEQREWWDGGKGAV